MIARNSAPPVDPAHVPRLVGHPQSRVTLGRGEIDRGIRNVRHGTGERGQQTGGGDATNEIAAG